MKIKNQKGNVLLFAIVAMTAISVLGTGIYFLTTTSTFSGLDANAHNRAYQLAVAGRDYALAKNLANMSRSFTMTNGDKFDLLISGDAITSTGIVNAGTPYEARRTITATKTGFGSQADLTFAKDIAAMGITQPTSAPSDFISKTDTTLSLGKVGSSYGSKFGAVVYSGNAVQGNCLAGKCEFGNGFNAFFVFQIVASTSGADGFTFTFFNGNGVDVNGKSNDALSVGGYAGMGELLGYAGDSYVSSGYYLDGQGGRGIQPPKVALEFDPYSNSGMLSVCNPGNRADGSRSHAALVFWGDNTTSCGSTVGENTFDDNRHGVGTDSATDPINAKSPTSHPTTWEACSYFNGNAQCGTSDTLGWPSAWLTNAPDNVYAMRMEVRRNLNGSNNYDYRIKVWIKKCASGDLTCAAYDDASNLANPKISYTDSAPTLDRTVQLDETYHQAFNTTLFGWTTATGGATQNVSVTRFKMNFLKELGACVNHRVWNDIGSSGSTTYFKINGAGCTGVVKNCFIGHIGSSESISGFTDASCLTATSPSSISYNQAVNADTNKDCSLNFSGTDKSGGCVNYGVLNNMGSSGSTTYFKINGAGCTGVVKDSFIGNIGCSGTINGFTDAACTIATLPSSISYDQSMSADTNKNCAVNFSGSDK